MRARLVYAAIVVLGLLVAIGIAGPAVQFSQIFTSLGVIGLIIGFALIRTGDDEGTVSFRSTLLRTYDGVDIFIPNGTVFTTPVENLTVNRTRRSRVELRIARTASVARARQVIRQTLQGIDGVLAPAPAARCMRWEGVAGQRAGALARGAVTAMAVPGRATPAEATGRLLTRPHSPTTTSPAGLHALRVAATRDALLYVPSTYRADRPAPLVLSLHGAGGDAESGFYPLRPLADAAGLLILSPASRVSTWDVIRGDYGSDVALIDRALAAAFDRVAVDPELLAIGGFSDGASYALSIGIMNGDLFPHILAFSPGFMAPNAQRGRPRIFVSHGTRDAVLPIDVTSRRIVPQLEKAGFDVTYAEFDGPHTVPPAIARQALDWYLPMEDAPR